MPTGAARVPGRNPNHLVEVRDLVARATGGRRMDAIVAALQRAASIFDGMLRPVMIARIRTDSTEAVVAFAQALCLAFDQRFVGIEVSGRYIRVYSDDTG